MKDIEKIKYYSAFSYLFVNPLFKSQIFEYFDYDIKHAFLADETEIQKMCEKLDINIPRTYVDKRDKIDVDLCYKNAFLDERVNIITYEDEKYPPLLKEIPDFPLALYYLGDIEKISYDYTLAVVGSRKATNEAKIALDNIISGLNNSKIVIVSGLAYGIDAQAHISALKNNLTTIGVIASGLDIIYPYSNKKLYFDIVQNNGLIFSEYPLKVQPVNYHFPQRNRIITGMSKGTLVAEAQIKSGAMISANLTLDYNRELMCIPGNIMNPNTSGIYNLIKNGAGIVSKASDLLEQLGWESMQSVEDYNLELNDIQKNILDIISMEAKTFDEIALISKQNTVDIMTTLTELELKGLIKQMNNKYYILK